jgi:hypothetical protein
MPEALATHGVLGKKYTNDTFYGNKHIQIMRFLPRASAGMEFVQAFNDLWWDAKLALVGICISASGRRRRRSCVARRSVGWVERSDTHHRAIQVAHDGFRKGLNPSCSPQIPAASFQNNRASRP